MFAGKCIFTGETVNRVFTLKQIRMAYFKPMLMKNSGKYYPVAVIVDRPMESDELVAAVSEKCTVHKADVLAVLAALTNVMAAGMNAGRSVHLPDLGYFRYTIRSEKGGKNSAKEVTADDVAGTRVRFMPESRFGSGKRTVATRALAPVSVRWVRWEGEGLPDTGGGTDPDSGEEPGGGGMLG